MAEYQRLLGKPLAVVLVLLCRDGTVYLPKSLKGITAGYLTGQGGKLEPDEDADATAVREVPEEVGLDLGDAGARKYAGCIRAHWETEVVESGVPGVFNVDMHVITVEDCRGTPKATEAFELGEFYPIDDLPYDKMMPTDEPWIEEVLKGGGVRGDLFCRRLESGLVELIRHDVWTF